MRPNSPGQGGRGHQCGHGDGGQIAGQGKVGPVQGRGCRARAHSAHYAPNADPEGHDESSQQAHNGSLPKTARCGHTASPTSLHTFPALMGTALPSHLPGPPLHVTGEPEGSLTGGLAKGKNIPRQKSPSSGPPTMPKMLMAACGDRVGGKEHRGSETPASPALPQSPPAGSARLALRPGADPMRTPDVRNGQGKVLWALL